MSNSSVGIYMPAYNVSSYIGESMNSIINQSFRNWELVIIDDGSTDDTFEAARKGCKGGDDRINIIKKYKHCGRIGQVKNECIAKLSKKHDYLCHVGSDDHIPNYCLETFVNYMDKHPEIGACCGNFVCYDDSGNEWSFPHVANSGEFNPNIMLQYMTLFPMRFYKRTAIESVGGYSNELTSAVDYDLGLKICEKFNINRIKDPITYYYRQHSQQVSTKARPEQNANAKTALENALKRRGIKGKVVNGAPPFVIEYEKDNTEEHFIWGK